MTDKEKKWDEMSEKISLVTDALELPIDENIKSTVIVLNLLGFTTSASCEGHTDRDLGPYVDIEDPASEKDFELIYELEQESGEFQKARERVDIKLAEIQQKLLNLLEEFYKQRKVNEASRLIIVGFNWIRLQNQGFDIIKISKDKEGLLKSFQKEMFDFTEFLKNKYFS